MIQSQAHSDVPVHDHVSNVEPPPDIDTHLDRPAHPDNSSSPSNPNHNITPPRSSSSPSSQPQVILGSPITQAAPVEGQPSCISPLDTRSRPALPQSSPASNETVYVDIEFLYTRSWKLKVLLRFMRYLLDRRRRAQSLTSLPISTGSTPLSRCSINQPSAMRARKF